MDIKEKMEIILKMLYEVIEEIENSEFPETEKNKKIKDTLKGFGKEGMGASSIRAMKYLVDGLDLEQL